MTTPTPTFPPMRFDNKEIGENNPWLDDALNREVFSSRLTALIQNGVSPYVISINGAWGTGKTFMLKRWQQQLKNDGYQAIYYNAWEDDFCTNPLISIIGKIGEEIKGDELKELVATVKEIAKPLVFKMLLRIIKLNKEELQSEIDNAIDQYSEETARVLSFKEKLETLTIKIQETHNGHPLVFIIDELDRCRPTFAIEVLEHMKHIFSVPGIVFVLGMNKEELQESIKHVYGNIDAKVYLQRFYDIGLNLNVAKSSNYCKYLIDHNINPLQNLIKDKDCKSYAQSSMRLLPNLVHYLNLSLRDTEHCFRTLCFVLEAQQRDDYGLGWATICLIVLRHKEPDLYSEFIQDKCLCKDVINYMHKFIPDNDDNTCQFINKVIAEEIYALAPNIEWDNICKEITSLRQGEEGKFPHLADRTISTQNRLSLSFSSNRINGSVQHIADLLDLVDDSR